MSSSSRSAVRNASRLDPQALSQPGDESGVVNSLGEVELQRGRCHASAAVWHSHGVVAMVERAPVHKPFTPGRPRRGHRGPRMGDEPFVPTFVRGLPLARAAVIYAAQLRQPEGTAVHPLEVAALLYVAGYSETVVTAAVLHDTVEDDRRGPR